MKSQSGATSLGETSQSGSVSIGDSEQSGSLTTDFEVEVIPVETGFDYSFDFSFQ